MGVNVPGKYYSLHHFGVSMKGVRKKYQNIMSTLSFDSQFF